MSAAAAAWEAGAAATATGSRAAVAAKTDRARRSFMKISFPVLRTLGAFVSRVIEFSGRGSLGYQVLGERVGLTR